MRDSKKLCEQHIVWKVATGNRSFWWDNWTGKGPLSALLHQQGSPRSTKISEYMQNGTWNIPKHLEKVPPHIVDEIQGLKIYDAQKDFAIWIPETSGRFTCKSAWRSLRKFKTISLTSIKSWHSKLPFKVSFFILRMLTNSLPTDDKICRLKIHGPSRCHCCKTHKSETIEHIFREGDIAKEVWNFFSGSCGINNSSSHIRPTMINWWIHKTNNKVQEMLLQCLPSIICWELWKHRCTGRFEETNYPPNKIIDNAIY